MVDSILTSTPPLRKDVWRRMKGWYKTVTKCLPPTARVTLEQVTTEWEALYRWVPPPGIASQCVLTPSRLMTT